MKSSSSKVKKTLALTLASLCTTVSSMLLSMLMVRLLSLGDLAVYKQTLLAYQTFVPVLGLGISQGLYYVFSRNEHRQRAVVHESWLLLVGMGTLYALFMLLGGRGFLAKRVNNPAVVDTLLWMVPLAILSTPASIQPTIFVYRDKIPENARFTVLGNLFCVLAVMAVIFFKRTGNAAVGADSIFHCLVYTIGLILAYRLVPKDDAKISFDSIKTILKVSVPLGISSMLGTLSNSLDKWIISFMRTREEYAVFSYGAHELPFLSTIASAISTVIVVEMVKYSKEGRYEESLSLFKSVAKVTSYFIFPVMMFFMVVAEPFYEFMYTKTMLPAVPIFRVYLLVLPIRTVMYGPLMIAMGKSKQVLYRTIAGLVSNLILSAVLVWWIGTIGATVATVITLYTVNIPINLRIISRETKVTWKKVLPFMHFAKCLLMSFIPAVGCFLALPFLGEMALVLRLVLAFFIYVILLLPMFYLLFRDDFMLYWHKSREMIKGCVEKWRF